MDNKLTQDQMAEVFGCSRSQLNLWENGKFTPSKMRRKDMERKMNIYIPQYCCIGDCNREGEKAHLITRATLPKELWENEAFYVYLCREHHHEFHQIGMNTFGEKYGIAGRIDRARQVLLELNEGSCFGTAAKAHRQEEGLSENGLDKKSYDDTQPNTQE